MKNNTATMRESKKTKNTQSTHARAHTHAHTNKYSSSGKKGGKKKHTHAHATPCAYKYFNNNNEALNQILIFSV